MSYIYRIQSKKKLFSINLTLLFVIINVVAFLVVRLVEIILKPDILSYVALSVDGIISYKFWTFLTSMFMHASFFHLFANMLSLIFIGSLLERIIGKKRFFWFYMVAGIFAGLMFILSELFIQSGLPAVGASGAIFGLAGLLMILTPNLPVYMMFLPIPIKMKYAVPVMLLLLWVISAIGNIPIGNTAHLGGFIVGLIYGLYLKNKYKNKTKYIGKVFS